MSERGSGLGPFIFGVIVGAFAGVLFAPARGEVTRRRLGRRVDALRDLAEEKFDELAGGVESDADGEATDDEPDVPSARDELERRLRESRRRRRVERAARGRAAPPGEEDEPVA